MSESEDAGSGCGQGHQEQNGVLQPEHDGGLRAGFGMFTLERRAGMQGADNRTAEQADGQERRSPPLEAQGYFHPQTASVSRV